MTTGSTVRPLRDLFSPRPTQRDHIPAFPGICARNEVQRTRVVRQLIAGAVLTVSVSVGALLSQTQADPWVLTAVTCAVSVLDAIVAANRGLTPAGSIFFIVATADVGSMPHGAPVWVAAAVAAASAAQRLMVRGDHARRVPSNRVTECRRQSNCHGNDG